MSFEDITEPYLELEGVEGVALISTDGLLVSEAGTSGCDFEVVGAHAAASLTLIKELAEAMGSPAPKVVSLNLGSRGLILAPLTGELFLIIAGDAGILRYAAGGPVFS